MAMVLFDDRRSLIEHVRLDYWFLILIIYGRYFDYQRHLMIFINWDWIHINFEKKLFVLKLKSYPMFCLEMFSVENLETFSMENPVNWNQTNVKKMKWMEDICVSLKCKRLVELICWKYLCFFYTYMFVHHQNVKEKKTMLQ